MAFFIQRTKWQINLTYFLYLLHDVQSQLLLVRRWFTLCTVLHHRDGQKLLTKKNQLQVLILKTNKHSKNSISFKPLVCSTSCTGESVFDVMSAKYKQKEMKT